MPQLPQSLGFNLADTLAGDAKVLAHFFQRSFGPVFEAESHSYHAFLARSQRIQSLPGDFFEVDTDDGVGR